MCTSAGMDRRVHSNPATRDVATPAAGNQARPGSSVNATDTLRDAAAVREHDGVETRSALHRRREEERFLGHAGRLEAAATGHTQTAAVSERDDELLRRHLLGAQRV